MSRKPLGQLGQAPDPEALELESYLDSINAELATLFRLLSAQVARLEVTTSDIDARNRHLRRLIHQAKEAEEHAAHLAELASKPSAQQPTIEIAAPEEAEAVPRIANIDAVLAQARAIRGSTPTKTPKPAPTRSGQQGSRGGQATSTGRRPAPEGNPGKGGGARPAAGVGAGGGLPKGKAPLRSASRRSAADERGQSTAGTTMPGPQAGQPPGSAPHGAEQQPPPPAPEPKPMPSLPRLPRRVVTALDRLKARKQERMADAASTQAPSGTLSAPAAQVWTRKISSAGSNFSAALSQAVDPQTACDVQADRPSSKWVRLVALDRAQQWLTDTIEAALSRLQSDASDQRPPHPVTQDIEDLWAEVQEEHSLLTAQEDPLPSEVAKWRDAALKAMLSTAKHTRKGSGGDQASQRKAAAPADVWLPPPVLCSALPPELASDLSSSPPTAPEDMWRPLLFPSSVGSRTQSKKGARGLLYKNPRELANLSKARHQLQASLMQLHLERAATRLLPAHAAPAIGSSNPRSRHLIRERYAARLRLADAFLSRGLDRGLCTLAEVEQEE
mmetsp:Transcript_37586/g.106151  ORF Transcript_37586/g.106151 Transcript_37586/m.106151 type:complete len:559 (-) Transcript_37586:245-1921(-)|eukprot:CAMPEP_0117659672 /NCGR_PEP_ID=MMETSP0804-20121206/6557_1 /TAXON_ID=1074897 /ORGANISM="Tetraselmis astigmatica, Strain CCMP880" /LENGTH=558 /DNA_ID=CAMNT_0005466345 /DNA_START=106 /DNA_END=1782 /DNA_ORIENTATION=+